MKSVFIALLLSFSAAVSAADAPDNYQSACAACHVSGAAGAPKTGDVDAWESRLEKGMDTLVESVKNGMNAMPPTGLCATCTDDEYKALIIYMASPAE